MHSVEQIKDDSGSENEADVDEMEEEMIFDTECSGIQSLIRATKKSINVSIRPRFRYNTSVKRYPFASRSCLA